MLIWAVLGAAALAVLIASLATGSVVLPVTRTIVAPSQLPVGVVTALAGVPMFLWMLLKRPR